MAKKKEAPDRDDDKGIRLRKGAKGDFRPYLHTNTAPDGHWVQGDEDNPKVAYCMGKRLWLGGKDTILARLFFLLAKHPGRFHPNREIDKLCWPENIVDPAIGSSDDDVVRRDGLRRKLVSRLKSHLHDAGLSENMIVVPHKIWRIGACEGYVLLLFQDQHWNDGDAPRPSKAA